jgi:hypothetical protein
MAYFGLPPPEVLPAGLNVNTFLNTDIQLPNGMDNPQPELAFRLF